jgi:flavodoxin
MSEIEQHYVIFKYEQDDEFHHCMVVANPKDDLTALKKLMVNTEIEYFPDNESFDKVFFEKLSTKVKNNKLYYFSTHISDNFSERFRNHLKNEKSDDHSENEKSDEEEHH